MIFRHDAGGLLTIERTRTLENFKLVLGRRPNFASAQLASDFSVQARLSAASAG
jgi:hypothetical protein